MSTQPTARQANPRENPPLMSASEIERTLVRLAHDIVDKSEVASNLGLVGIRRRGVPLAHRLSRIIQQIANVTVPVGALDISLYRDDLSTVGPRPVVQKTELGFSIVGKDIILVDDVLYTGRTTRAALDALFEHGRPRRVQLCVLIDRGLRELPIEAAYVGRHIATRHDQVVEVRLKETDSAEKVTLVEKSAKAD